MDKAVTFLFTQNLPSNSRGYGHINCLIDLMVKRLRTTGVGGRAQPL